MHLRILLPSEVFADKPDVVRITANTSAGSLGLLEHRLDCVAALVPGIMTYETKHDGTVYLALDEGVLVKTGADVLVSVRQAIGGQDLGHLQDAVKKTFLALNTEERSVRDAVTKMEVGFIGRFAEFEHER
jgi:F-type H+-transporting ATPase subunit epsilon